MFDLSARNPFVNAQPKNLWNPESEDDSLAAKIWSRSQFYKKEYALDTTLYVSVYVQWTHSKTKGEQADRFFLSPLLYRPCKVVKSKKVNINYRLEVEEGPLTVNPIIRHFFRKEFDLDLPSVTEDIDGFLKEFSVGITEGMDDLPIHESFSDLTQWCFIKNPTVGVFNYKKSLLGEDYDEVILSPNQSVIDLLYAEKSESSADSDTIQIDDLDESQLEILKSSSQNNLVIQGPPGTGKSHTIVSMISNFLAQGKKVLFVSEKRSALEVVYERLKSHDLHYWTAYFNTEKDEKKEFYRHLGTAWEKLNDINTSWEIQDFRKTDISDWFNYYPSGLKEYNSTLDGSIQDLVDVLVASGMSSEELSSSGKVPSYSDWKMSRAFLQSLEERFLKDGGETLADLPFSRLNKAILLENDPILILEKRLKKIIKNLDRIIYVQGEFDMDMPLDKFTKLCVTASVLSMVNKTQLDLLHTDSKGYKSFNRLAKKYEILQNKLVQLERTNAMWEKKPTASEISQLIDLLKNRPTGRGILGMLQRQSPLLTETFKHFDKRISDEARIQMLESIREEWKVKTELSEVKLKLKHDLQLIDPENEIDHIIRLRNKLENISQDESLEILTHERSLEFIQHLDSLHPLVTEINNLQRFILREPEDGSVHDLKKRFDSVLQSLPDLTKWLGEMQEYFKMKPEIQNFLLNNDGRTEELTAKVAYHNLLEQTRFQPMFAELNGEKLLLEHQRSGIRDQEKYQSNKDSIALLRTKTIRDFEGLLKTPASKLKEDQKQLKKQYRGAKRTLLHELNKRQQHLPVKTLCAECEDILFEVQPIWMMNPLAVSGSLPCHADMFDVVIFDEASQIPLEDSIPSIYRAKQVIIVGDSEQMPPSSFFSSKTENKTILDEASVSFQSVMLKWHYRSDHPDLIKFSNQVFYESELQCLPPIGQGDPIEFVKVEGVFDSGKNIKEAEELAQRAKELLAEGVKDLGIIAFSKEQEKEIDRQLNKLKVDQEFITLRNLENVQGIECDYVLISIGYGYNVQGVFRQNFGPVNQDMGANRLNVMFSRARKKMIVFSSVNSTDFKLSDNRGVQILREFIRYAESARTSKGASDFSNSAHRMIADILDKNDLDYSYYSLFDGVAISGFVNSDEGKFLLVDPGLSDGEPTQVYPLITSLKKRFKEVKIVLSIDLWKNNERISDEVVSFFSKRN